MRPSLSSTARTRSTLTRVLLTAPVAVAALAWLASPAGAQEQPTYERFAEDAAATNTVVLDNIFIFVAAVLVFLMQPGFALVEAGLTRAKNAANIMMKNLMDVSIGVLVFAAIGWGIAYPGDFSIGSIFGFAGFGIPGLMDLAPADAADYPLNVGVDFFFQAAFAATAATIVSGAVAGRTQFQRVHRLLGGDHRADLPDRRVLEVGRWLARRARLRRFRRLRTGAHGGRLRRTDGSDRPRSPYRQVRQGRQTTRHSGPQRPAGHRRCVHPLHRLVRVQPRLAAPGRSGRPGPGGADRTAGRGGRPCGDDHQLGRAGQARRLHGGQRHAGRSGRDLFGDR